MLFDAPESLVEELIRRQTAVVQATTNYINRPTSFNNMVKNTAINALNKTLDKCSVELGQALTPRPTVETQEDGTFKLLYPTP